MACFRTAHLLAATLILAVTLCYATSPAWAQGTVNFRTRSGGVDAPVRDTDGATLLAGDAFRAQLYAGPPGSAESALQAVGTPVPFLTGTSAGYVNGGIVTVTGIAEGAPAALQMRVWETSRGGTFEQASAAGSKTGRSIILTLTLGGGLFPAASLTGLQPFQLSQGGPPVIISQPQSRTNVVETAARFSVSATGTEPLSYQWRFNGANLAGATSTSLTISNVQFTNAGNYTVVVTNAYGSVTSAVAVLTVTPVIIPEQGWVVAWGDNFMGQTNVPSGLTNVVAVAGGYWHSLALRADGTVVAWGDNSASQTNVPAGLSNVTMIAAGMYHSLALRSNRTVVAWGDNFSGQASVPSGLSNVVAVAAGGWHSLALKADGTVVAWGSGGGAAVPAGLSNVVAIAAGGKQRWGLSSHSLALRSDGTVVEWGDYFDDTLWVNLPAAPPGGLSHVKAIACGTDHSLALRSNGTVVAWGANSYSQTNVPAGLTNVALIAGGLDHSLARLSNGTLVAWGTRTNLPSDLFNVGAIAAGWLHDLAVVAVVAAGVPPTLTSQPQSRTNIAGTTVGFSVEAVGTEPLSYQWHFNGIPLSGATGSTLALTNVQPGQAGEYCAVVTNAFGAVTSQVATLTVTTCAPPEITSPPFPLVRQVGESVTMSCTATGTEPLSYQWRLNGTNNLAGATNTTLTLTNIQPSDAGSYEVVVTNACGSTTGLVARLTVPQPGVAPTITEQPQSRTNAAGSAATFSVVATGTAPLRYQWRFNGVSLAGATSTNLTLASVQFTNAGNYTVVVTNAYGAVTSQVATLTVTQPAIAPFITRQPRSRTNALGTTASFSVGVTGSAPLAYQWRFNDTSLAGATSSKLTLTNVQIGNAGNYTVVVTNAYGSVTSAVAVLTVSPTLPSQGWVIAWGNNTYGQTNIPAGLSNAVAVAAGSEHSLALRYDGTVVAWGGTGSATSVPAGLNDAVAIAAGDFYSLALLADSTVVAWGSDWSGETDVPAELGDVVGIAAGGSHGLALRADGTVVAWGNNDWGQTNVPAGLSDVVGVAAGVWHSLALRRDGTVVGWGGFPPDGAEAVVPDGLSNVVAIAAGGKSMFAAWNCYSLALRADGTVVAWGSVTVPPGLEGVSALAAGGWHSLALRTNDTLFAWGSNESGQTDVPCGLTNITAIAAGGLHSLAVVGGVGPCGSAPSITSQPQSRTNVAGTAATFSVAATGSAPLSYQWRFNGANLAGATGTDLALTSVQPTNAGNYTVVVTNAYGSVTSQVATLTVWVPPAITAEPQSRTNVAGTTNVFCVTATGTPPLSYQWRKDGVNLTDGGNVSGATTTCLTLANVQPADAGGYTVVVTNLAGAVTSTMATLTITEPGIAPSIIVQPQSRTNLPGSTANFTVVATGTTPLSYQWLKNGLRLAEGENVSGTSGTNLTLVNVQTSDAGAYQVVVTNTSGSVTSQVAMLTVTSQPGIQAGLLAYYPFDVDARDHSGHPEADLSNFGATPALADLRACFSFTPGAYTYHSNFNLTRVPLSISLWFKLRSVQPVGSKLIGNWGFTQPDAYRGFRVAQGSPNSLDLAVGGLPSNATYESLQACETGRWYHLVACFDADGVSAYVDGVLKRRVDLALAYRAQAPKMWLGGRGTPSDDWWGDLDGWLDEVRIYDRILQPEEVLLLSQQTNFAPVITTQPQSRTNVVGTVATFSVNALGTPPLTYQWRKGGSNLSDGGNVSGATTATLTLSGVQFADGGSYSVVVANVAGSVTSQEAMLTVIPPVPRAEGVVVAWGQNNWGQTDVPVGLSNVVAVAAGSMHNLALKNDGTVVGWGGDNYGKTTPPAGLSNVVAVAAGDNHSLALWSDGTVVGWGYNGNGQTNPPPGLSDVVAIAAGYDHNLALTGNGLLVAWGGSPLFGQTNVPASASNVVAISAGQYVSLALRGDGTLVAWGYGSSGETNIPAGATNIVAISAGRFHCLALKRDGTVLAWGNNSYGQTNVPVNLTNVVAIAGGAYHSLALQADGTLVGWGWNQSGQTTIPPELGNGNVLAIAARGNHSLALKRQAVLGVAPSIAVQPQSRTNAPGTTATFTVGALGTAPLSYQWQKEGTSLRDGGTISGAASPVLTLASVQTSDVGNYQVVVTNAFGSVTSQVATLALTPAVPGNVRWQFFAGDIVASSPAIGADGTIYVGAWNGKVFALNGATGAKSWEFQTADRVHSSPAIGADGTVYVGSYDQKVYALDGTTGAKRWEFATQAPVASCSPAIGADGTVYVGSQDGRLYALNGATGQQRWAFATGGEVNSSPAIGADGTVYFGSLDGRLYALSGATGAKRWEFLTGNQIHSSPAIGADGTVYVGSYDSKVYAVDGATGRLRWTYTTGRYIWCGPTVGPDGTVYVGSHDGNVYALDGATGQRRWVTWTGGYVGPSPAIAADGTLYVGSGPGAKLFALDCATGRKLWEFRAGGDVSSSVAIGADGTLYFGSHDGQVYALHSGSVGGLAESAWPMFHQNARHTGSAEALLPSAPAILTQPASLTVTVGASATFGVIAAGAAPLTYQWWFNNTALPAATNANFTLSNASLANAGNYHVGVANTFGSVTSQVATLAVVPSGGSNLLAGVGHDGYVAGGTVFFDANRNGQLDANEPATTTDDQGQFELAVPLDQFDANHNGQLDPAEGCLVLQGGLDIATGQPLRTSLSAPPGCTVVTPLTALLQEMLDQTPGLSVSNAQAQLQAALGVSNRVDLTRYDAFAAAQTNDPLAGPVLRAASQVQDTIVQITALVEGASPSQGADELAGVVTATLAAQLQTNAAFNLSAPTQIENLLTQAVSRAGLDLPAIVTEGAAQIIAEVNQLKAQAAESAVNALDAAGEISRIQGVAQGSIAEELALVGANAKVIDDAVAANTGDALQATVEAAPVGDVTGQETRPGTFAFSQSEFRVAEDGTPLTAVMVIRTDGNKGPVGLRITLSDGTARRVDGDYTVTNLDLQFGDGEISRTLNLATALTDDAEAEANETIQLTLSLLPGAPPQAQLGAPTQALLTLVDNDAPGTFAFTGAEYRVREDGTAVNAVTIRRDQGSAGVVSLIVTSVELAGGATAGSDFAPTPVVVTFLPGNMNRIVTIPVVADVLAEGDESLLLSLALAPGAPSGASLGAQSSAVLTLLDVASAPPWVRLGVLPQGAAGEFKFTLTGTPGRTCVVQTSSDLLAWENSSTNLLTETPLVFTGPPVQSEARRFYRAVLLP